MQYTQEKIAIRIKAERNAADLSMEELAERVNVSRNTIAVWEKQGKDKGGRIPQLSDLLNMCNVFKCELGYLLGEHDCKTRTATDVKAKTGLNDETVNTLFDFLHTGDVKYACILNTLLNQKHGLRVLNAIYEFLIFTFKKSTDTVEIWAPGDDTFEKLTLSNEMINNLLLFEVQNALKQLKKEDCGELKRISDAAYKIWLHYDEAIKANEVSSKEWLSNEEAIILNEVDYIKGGASDGEHSKAL